MGTPTNADLRPRQGAPDAKQANDATRPWWRITGNETEDACYLAEMWLDKELELIQLPIDVITLAAEQVQDVRLSLLEKSAETEWPELIVSAFLGFMTNSPYGGQLIQAVTKRALGSLFNLSALLRASQTYTGNGKVEFFKYAGGTGDTWQYVPAKGTMEPVSTTRIAALYDRITTFLTRGAEHPAFQE